MYYCVTLGLCQGNPIRLSRGLYRPKGQRVKFQSSRAPPLLNPTVLKYLVIYFLFQCPATFEVTSNTYKEFKSHLLKREINLKLPISRAQMIFNRCWERNRERPAPPS